MFLGLDLGTSGLRALLIDDAQETIAVEDVAYPVSHLQSGWSEQDPADWINAVEMALDALAAKRPDAVSNLQGIGVSGQMHGATLVDNSGNPLRPCILWNDTRAHREAAALDALPQMRKITGNVVFPGFTAPKLLWVKANEPEVFDKIVKVLLPKDYLGYWLTGEYMSEMSDAAGTAWLDTGARAWSDAALGAGGMTSAQMPGLIEGCDIAGDLRGDLKARWGIQGRCVVAGGGADNAAAACGTGALHEGEGFVSLGTSGVLLVARGAYAPDPATAVHTFCHAVPETWYQMGVMLAATDCMNWLADRTGQRPAELTDALGDDLRTPGSVRFLPYLSGERTPHNDAAIRGAFLGLDIATDNSDLTHAVIEGVSFGLRDSLQALRATGASPERLLAIGGGTGSRYWVGLLATILGLPLDILSAGETGAALGAARLAMIAATGAAPADVMWRPQIAETIEPDTALTGAYADAHDRFTTLYPSIKALT